MTKIFIFVLMHFALSATASQSSDVVIYGGTPAEAITCIDIHQLQSELRKEKMVVKLEALKD